MTGRRGPAPAARAGSPRRPSADALLSSVAPFRNLCPDQLRQLRRQLDLVELPEGHVLYQGGTTLYEVAFVLDGCLAAAPPLATVYGPGDAIDVRAVLTATPLQATVVTMRGSLLAIIERRRFLAALDDCPSFAASILRQLATGVAPTACKE